jgi:hypothetical protein
VTWWAWTLLWVVLVAAAGLVLYLAARRLFRQGAALARELGDLADRLAAVTRTLDEQSEAAPAPNRARPSTQASPRRPNRARGRQDVR